MSEIEPFEFEWEGRKHRVLDRGDDVVVQVFWDCDNEWHHWGYMGGDSRFVIRALVAERTRHKDVFARLKALADDGESYLRGISDNREWVDNHRTQLDALQVEWEGK